VRGRSGPQSGRPFFSLARVPCGAGQTQMTDDPISLPPEQIAELKRQLQAANARLIAVERRRLELRDYIATLTAQLKRAERYPDG
jgi:hypothetical protein